MGHYGYLPTDARTLRRELDSRGLNAIAATAMAGHLDHPSDWPRIETTVTRIGEVAASAGARYLVLIDDSYTAPGSRVSAPETDDDGWKCMVEAIHRVADMVREVGYDGWATVEQDMYQPRDRPLNIAARTRSYLRKIGMG